MVTTRVLSVAVPVTDQDRALQFYTEVLGCEVVADVEAWPGSRWLEVAPPDSSVSIVLLLANGDIPVAIRLGTTEVEAAFGDIRRSGTTVYNESLIRLDGVPEMFHFADPDGNGIVFLADSARND